MTDPRLNQIRIKTGVLKRNFKEKQAYEKELEREKERLNSMKEQNLDEHSINKQQEVINETVNLLPDCQKRIKAAYNELQKLVEEVGNEFEEEEIYLAAKNLLEELK